MKRKSFLGLLIAAPLAFVAALTAKKEEEKCPFNVELLKERIESLTRVQFELQMDLMAYGVAITRKDDTGFYRVAPNSEEGIDMMERMHRYKVSKWSLEDEYGKMKQMEIFLT